MATVTLKQTVTVDDLALTGADVAVTPEGASTPGIPVALWVSIADGATGNVDVLVDKKIGILDVWLVKRLAAGGAGDTLELRDVNDNGITDAMSLNVADRAVVRAGQLNDAFLVVPAGGTLRFRRTKASAANAACYAVVLAVRL